MEAAKWDAILDQAARVFGRHGFKKTSMDDVAKLANVAKGTLYLGCTSKQDLFYQVVLKELRDWNAVLMRSIDPRVPAEQLLVAIAAEAFATRTSFPLAHGLALGELDQDLPGWHERLDELRAHSLTTLLEILRIGVRQGRFRADLDLEVVAGVVLDIIASAMMCSARRADAEQQLAIRAHVAFELVLDGLRPRGAEVGAHAAAAGTAESL